MMIYSRTTESKESSPAVLCFPENRLRNCRKQTMPHINRKALPFMKNKKTSPITNIPYDISLRFVKIAMALFTGVLLVSAFLLTCYSADMEKQLVLFGWDNPLLTLPGTAFACFILFAAAALASKGSLKSGHRLLRLLVLCWCLAVGIVLILWGKSVPAGDGYSVYAVAERLAAGDTSVIHPTDSYLSYYPQQVGLAAFWEILIRIWNLIPINQRAYHFIKLIYLLLECVIIIFQEKIIHILWNDEQAECLYLLLAGANCPLLMYASFVYGEIPSLAAISVSFYLLLRLLAVNTPTYPGASEIPPYTPPKPQERIPRSMLPALGSLFFLTLSVMLRKNSLIFMIAAVLVLSLCALKQKRPPLLLLAALCAAASLAILPGIGRIYEYRSGSRLSSGVPAMSYFAMGMQESSRADGWYNGFNFNTYQDSGMDRSAAIAVSREAIRQRLAYFHENPGYAAGFYSHKYLSQWADGTYACRQATLATFGGRTPLFESLYQGEYSKYLIGYCNIYQNILYLGAFRFCLAGLGKRSAHASDFRLAAYLGLISALGGFLFHMIWEANARYIFPYGLAMLPYTAKGLAMLWAALSNISRRSKGFQSNKARKPHARNTQATGE